MTQMHQFGVSASGLMSQKLRDLDAAAPRLPLPPRALPDDVRRRLRLPNRTDQHVIRAPKSDKALVVSAPPDPLRFPARQNLAIPKKVSPYLLVSCLFTLDLISEVY